MIGWPGWYDVYRLSRDAAARLPDLRQRVVHLNYFAWAAAACAHRYDEGADAARTAYRLAARTVGSVNVVRALVDLGRFQEALASGDAAMTLAIEFGEPGTIGHTHLAVGLAYAGAGSLGQAREDLGRAGKLLRGDPLRRLAVERLAAL